MMWTGRYTSTGGTVDATCNVWITIWVQVCWWWCWRWWWWWPVILIDRSMMMSSRRRCCCCRCCHVVNWMITCKCRVTKHCRCRRNSLYFRWTWWLITCIWMMMMMVMMRTEKWRTFKHWRRCTCNCFKVNRWRCRWCRWCWWRWWRRVSSCVADARHRFTRNGLFEQIVIISVR